MNYLSYFPQIKTGLLYQRFVNSFDCFGSCSKTYTRKNPSWIAMKLLTILKRCWRKKGLQCILNKRSDIKALIVLMKGLNEWKKMIHAKHDADWEINSLHETINYLIRYHITGNLIGTKGIKSQLSEKYRIKLLKFFFLKFHFLENYKVYWPRVSYK